VPAGAKLICSSFVVAIVVVVVVFCSCFAKSVSRFENKLWQSPSFLPKHKSNEIFSTSFLSGAHMYLDFKSFVNKSDAQLKNGLEPLTLTLINLYVNLLLTHYLHCYL